MAALRQRFTARELTGVLAHAAGLLPEPMPVTAWELTGLFDWGKVGTEDLTVCL